MPELPEVETIVRALRPELVGRAFVAVWNDWPRHIARTDARSLNEGLSGRRIEAIGRRGKYLVFSLDCPHTLIIHLKMSGHLAVVEGATPRHRHVHTAFLLDDGRELRFRDMRKFGKVYLVADLDDVLGGLGPEPLETQFTPEKLAGRLSGRRRAMKPLLLDQGVLAGVGNIYADEALFAAGIHPERTADSLTTAEIERLHAAIQDVLRLGIAREGASIDLYVKPDGEKGDMQNAVMVFRRTGLPCFQCGRAVERLVLGGRSTHFCPHCQK